MSYTTVFKLWPNTARGPEELVDLSNSHGSAPIVWDAMSQRWLSVAAGRWMLADNDDRMWRLARDQRVPVHQRAWMAMTFDRALVAAENFARAASDIRASLHDLAPYINPNHVNHWPAIAGLLEQRPDCPAVGFQMTSVSDNLWNGAWDDDSEDYAPYDWSLAEEVYEIALAAARGETPPEESRHE